MSAASIDRLLALLVGLLLASGLLTLRAGIPATAPLFILHGLLAGALAGAIGMKLRSSLPQAIRGSRWGRITLGLLVTLLGAAALGGGFAWVASGRILAIGPWTVLTLHVWAALALIPLLAVHLLPRRWRLLRLRMTGRRPTGADSALPGHRISRRTLLATAVLGVAGLGAWLAANAADVLAGGRRRFTGSRPLADGGMPPVTTFFGEPTPAIDPHAWRLVVRGRVAGEVSLGLDELEGLEQSTIQATLDCTSGWAMTTAWSGLRVATLLEAAGVHPEAREVVVRSVTGWATSLSLREARSALLATHVAGQPLPAGNGAPVRLVAPERRGLDWVKWVDRVEVV